MGVSRALARVSPSANKPFAKGRLARDRPIPYSGSHSVRTFGVGCMP